MNPNSITCDAELLRRSLADDLSEQQEEALAHHLSDCETCRHELDRLAAQSHEWSQIEMSLRREVPSQPQRDGIADGSHSESPLAERDGYLAADFAVDFLEPSDRPEALGRLEDIDILEVIGRGGMGIVLKGFQRELNRPVAVKVLAPHLAASAAARRRFAREAQATAVIVHPNVMPILTVHSSGKLPYLVMPFVPCESLQQRLDRDGPLETLDVLRIGIQTARGLAAAHAQGLVHRDVKPANILLEKGIERVMLTDFGLARAIDDASITRTGVIAGTPQYMSPEQARGEAIDPRSDLFSLGSVLYAICTGRPPFRAETSYGILRRITDNEPRAIREINPQIPDWLAGVIQRLLAKQPERRFASAAEVADLLEQCLAHVQQPSVAPLPTVGQPFQADGQARKPDLRWTRRPTRKVIWSCALLATTVATTWSVRLMFFDPPAGPQQNSGPMVPTASNPTEQRLNDSPEADWDHAQQQLDALLRDGDAFESGVEPLWENRPLPDSTTSGSPDGDAD